MLKAPEQSTNGPPRYPAGLWGFRIMDFHMHVELRGRTCDAVVEQSVPAPSAWMSCYGRSQVKSQPHRTACASSECRGGGDLVFGRRAVSLQS